MIKKRPGGVHQVAIIKCLSHLDHESIKQSKQDFQISLGNEMADTLAQRGAEEAMNDIREE
eukprot:8457544-Pyramimonas_sp.AAC.1